MFKILSSTKHLLKNKFTFLNDVGNCKKIFCRELAQFCRPSQCAKPKVTYMKYALAMKSTVVKDTPVKTIGWGISGVVILGCMVLIDKSCVLLAVLPLLLFHHKTLPITIKMIPRDLRFMKRYVHSKFIITKIVTDNLTLHKSFEVIKKKTPNNVMLVMDGQEWKYKEVNSYANRVSRLVQKHKLGKGDVVGVLVENCPEMIAIILGLSRIGVIGALINIHLKTHGLKHCIDISKCSILIVDKAHIDVVDEIKNGLDKNLKIYQLNDNPKTPNYLNFQEELFKESDQTPEVIVKPNYDDPLIYIYTSGTSGVPKAAIVPHSKFLVNTVCGSILLGLNKKDKIYNPLPLYHSTGLMVGAAPSIASGIPVVIRKRFSSHSYIKDCIKYKCTVGMYIGEICRFIFMVPPAETDNKHNIRFLVGNGLNIELWKKFQDRFNIKIIELYGSTEGNCNMINIEGKQGAVGFLPLIIPFFFYPFYVIKINLETLKPLRSPDGLCIKCDYGEPGMLVGRIKKEPDSQYYGYVNRKKDTQEKILHDVFKKGDSAFISGDILEIDKYQYFYFKDRTGDTFRWKGENVASVEVESIVMGLIHRTSACYGVKLKGYDGYAGMVSIEDPKHTVDVNKLLPELIHHLPKYSVPRFIRIVDKIEMTSTHKIVKKQLYAEGINLDIIKDKMYYLDNDTVSYLPLTKDVIKGIEDFKVPM